VIEQVPEFRTITRVPAVLQTGVVIEVKLTGRPELALAVIWKGGSLKNWLGIELKVIVCEPLFTMKLRVTGIAAEKFVFPVWLAVIEQVPGATSVTVAPETVHTLRVGEAKLTERPEPAVALTANGAIPNKTLLRGAKVIVCGSWLMTKPATDETTPPGFCTVIFTVEAVVIRLAGTVAVI
jgi:hypothetical protein